MANLRHPGLPAFKRSLTFKFFLNWRGLMRSILPAIRKSTLWSRAGATIRNKIKRCCGLRKQKYFNKHLKFIGKPLSEVRSKSPPHPFTIPFCPYSAIRISPRNPRLEFICPPSGSDTLKTRAPSFGKLWPSEGSVSEEALRIAAEEGFIWAATDEGILGRSMHTYFHRHNDGTVQDGRLLYQPHRYKAGSQSIDLFFRDHQLSDLIGFVYSRMDPETAARDLIHRIRMAARSAGDQASVVTIILDGENAWEYYPGNGREFLKRFYGLLASAPDIQALTPSEILATTPPNPLPRLMPGSWINANFNVWIGADEDNKAWDLLSDARNFFAKQSSRPDLNSDRIALARQELWIAEGSDWCWWYGPEHSTANDEEFDHLFRKHLSNIYRLLQGETPIELAAPIKRPRVGGYNIFPTALISPAIDGRETTYFEWLGAGIYLPDYRSGSIHQSGQFIKELHYGYDESALYLRVDLKSEFARKQHDFEIRVSIDGENHSRLQATISRDTLTRVEFWDGDQKLQYPSEVRNQVQVAYEHIFELRLNYSILHLDSPQRIALQVSFWVNQLPVQTVPREGWLSLELTKELVVW